MGLMFDASPLLSDDRGDLIEAACARLKEIHALLRAIETAELLSALPAGASERELHRLGVCLLSVMSRELDALVGELDRLTEISPPPPALQ